MKAIKTLSRFILGIVFLFSGFVKAIDPLGSAYKFSDYFQAFGLEFLDGLSLGLGIFLAVFELVLGLTLILGYQKKIVYVILLLFMGFFTLLTFVLALTNPVTDCGCFGDALVLTNWETFFKNVVLMVFVLILFTSRKRARNVHGSGLERSLILLIFTGGVVLSLTALRHLPFIDFRPYDVGTFIPGEMVIREGAPVDEYETILYYRNLETGENEAFSLENYPKDTSKYAFETSESILVNKGYEPPIHDFGILDPDGNDVTDEILNFEGYSLLLISYDLQKSDGKVLSRGNRWSELEDLSSDFRFIPVTASAGQILEEMAATNGLTYEFYAADETMLKTVVRSNPGFVLLKNGSITGKWAGDDFPEMEKWNGSWPEEIDRYKEEQDPEISQLIEEGYMEPLELNLIDFDRSAAAMSPGWIMNSREKLTWAVYILGVILLLSILQAIPWKQSHQRV